MRTRTRGFINLGTREKKLCTDLMTDRLSRGDMNRPEEVLLLYSNDRGKLLLWQDVTWSWPSLARHLSILIQKTWWLQMAAVLSSLC